VQSVVEIYEKSGKFYGRVLEIFDASHRKDRCIDQKEKIQQASVIGPIAIKKGFKKMGNEYNSGKF
jgi:hypothetical protein